MTVSFYIPRRGGSEKGFDHTFERGAALEIANQFYQTYHNNENDYALIFNADSPPADLIIITNYGVGVVELKNITGTIRGTVESAWHIHQNNTSQPLEVSSKYKNPFQQVRSYRLSLYHKMKGYARRVGPAMPDWMQHNGQFHLQAAVVFTDNCKVNLKLDPAQTKPWFEAILQARLPRWAYTLTFTNHGHRDPLSKEQIRKLAEELLEVEAWQEINALVDGSNIYGYLSVFDTNSRVPTNYPLGGLTVTLGREATNDIPLGATGISRQHARILRDQNDIYIEDRGSTNGTWLNGKRLEAHIPRLLEDGDQLIFGPLVDGKPKDSARRAKFTTRLSNSPVTQVFYPVE